MPTDGISLCRSRGIGTLRLGPSAYITFQCKSARSSKYHPSQEALRVHGGRLGHNRKRLVVARRPVDLVAPFRRLTRTGGTFM